MNTSTADRKDTAAFLEMIRWVAPGAEVEDKKPVIKPGVHITLKVRGADRRTVYCTMRRMETLQRVMDTYYDEVPEAARGTGKFCFDGELLRGGQTPAELHLEDGDVVDFITNGNGTRASSEVIRLGATRDEVKDRKPAIHPSVDIITLKVVDLHGRSVDCTIRTTDKLQVLMDLYHARVPEVERGVARFLLDGIRLRGSQTPAELGMVGGVEVEVDVLYAMLGGGVRIHASVCVRVAGSLLVAVGLED